jgi:hypothetical protein
MGMVAALVAAACMPVVWPVFGEGASASLKALVGQFGAISADFISDWLQNTISRLRDQDDTPRSKARLQQELERELLAALQAHNEQAARLRADAGVLLESVQGVQTALAAASPEVQLAFTEAFTELGGSFSEFGWMLDEARHTLNAMAGEQARQGAEQRHQTELLREFRVKLNLALRHLETLTTSTPAVAAPGESMEDAEGEELAPAAGLCPYKGLAAFQAEDAEWFFGREQLVAELVVRLSEAPFLAVVGPSGSGKSSLLRAGLLPAVWGGRLAGADGWITIVLIPGAHPLEELAARLGVECGVAAGSLLDDWQADAGRVRITVRQVLGKAPEGIRLLLLVDQFEELFTLCHDETKRTNFIQALMSLVGDSERSASVVVGIRADFYGRCADYPELAAVLQDHQVLVGPMSAAELRQAIEGPATRAGLTLEPGLVETILDDLGDEPGRLPLVIARAVCHPAAPT